MLKAIKDLVVVPELKNHYQAQSNDSLEFSISEEGQSTPIIINDKNEIIDGYRRYEVLKKLGNAIIMVVIQDRVYPTIEAYTSRNLHREKTVDDKIKDMRNVFETFPKRQGKKSSAPYDRTQLIIKGLNSKFKDESTISNLEYLLDNKFQNDFLVKQVLEKNEPIKSCVEFMRETHKIDMDNNFGFTKKLLSGEKTVKECNKLIKQRHYAEKNEPTFIIPDKCYSYKTNCLEFSKMKEYKELIDLIITSIPYFQLRKYDSSITPNSLGNEMTKEEYCENFSKIFKSFEVLLKKTSNVFINIGETYRNNVGLGIPQLLKYYIEKNTNLKYKDELTWLKYNPKPHNTNKDPRPFNAKESLLWFVVDENEAKFKVIKYEKSSERVKSKKSKYSQFTNFLDEQEVYNVLKTSVGENHELKKIYEDGHPAIMSPLLPIIPILMCSNEGDTVYDPFSGSNVVGQISLLLNRKAVSSEISKLYHSIGCEMLKKGIEQFDRNSLDEINNRIYHNNKQLLNAAA